MGISVCPNPKTLNPEQEGVAVPIHIMFQPDHLSAREMALEDVDVYVEEPAFLRALCAETRSVPRSAPMNVRDSLPCCLLPATSPTPYHVACFVPRSRVALCFPRCCGAEFLPRCLLPALLLAMPVHLMRLFSAACTAQQRAQQRPLTPSTSSLQPRYTERHLRARCPGSGPACV